tara:strand:+ start:219 stop:413 length:195 start_codon:yes stop_codon:yes gene_type:complete
MTQMNKDELLTHERTEMREAINSVGERRLNSIDRTINLLIGTVILLVTFAVVWAAPYILGGHIR